MDRIGIKCKQPPAKHNAMEQSHSPARDEQGAEVPLEYDNDKVDYCKGRERNGVFFPHGYPVIYMVIDMSTI